MPRNPQYDILFEPVKIGPVTAPNRFYQTPHANGMGYLKPRSGEAYRGLKAEGGWGVVCTEYCSIHPSSDDSPFSFVTLWDEDDVRDLAKTVDAIHAHGSLAGVELWHGGAHTSNRLTREPLIAPSGRPARILQPGQARAMDKQDIREYRGWQRDAALRARQAGFDIVYVYAGHDYLPFQFLSPRINRRSDEYGGVLANRVRLLRELIEDTKDAVGDTCAVAVRLAVDEMHGPDGITSDGEAREIISMLAELPDLWDVNVAGHLGNDSRSSRFSVEGYQEERVNFVKALTSKPVVGVGRFTSPDSMASQIKRGILDMIGAARPTIADPFLPNKIAEGREDEIRECIGCNICRAANNESAPLRCTQNPTVGEEWRRGWHPERIPPAKSESSVLVVGAGPAGLEASLALGRRGYRVTLVEATRDLGGRLVHEAALPSLASWIRVRDYREHMLTKVDNVEVFRESLLTAADVLEVGADHVVVATGSKWCADGIGFFVENMTDTVSGPNILTPGDVFAGVAVDGPVLVYDDEHYFMGGAMAERFLDAGHEVTYVTTETMISGWSVFTDEQVFIQKRLMEKGIKTVFSHSLVGCNDTKIRLNCVYTGREMKLDYSNLILVTGRQPNVTLYDELLSDQDALKDAEIKSVTRIGDCLVPSSIADAVFSGHRFARSLDAPDDKLPIRRERPAVSGKMKILALS